MVLDVVHPLPLHLHHHRHVQKHLVQLQQAPLNLLGRVVPALYLVHRRQHLPPAVLRHRPLQQILAVPVRDDPLNYLLLWDLSRDREVPPLDRFLVLCHHPLPEVLELHHELLELLAEAVGDGGAGAVDGGALAVAGQAAVGGVCAVHRLKAVSDVLGLLEDGDDVGVDAVAEGLEGLGLVEGLALLVGGLEAGEEVADGRHLFFDVARVLEEAAEVLVGGCGVGGHLDGGAGGGVGGFEVEVFEGFFLEVVVAEEGFGHEIVHLG